MWWFPPFSLPRSLFRVCPRLVYHVTWHFDLNTRANQGERNQASNWVNEFNCGLPSWSSVISCLSQRRVMGADTLWTRKARRGPPGTDGELGGSHQGWKMVWGFVKDRLGVCFYSSIKLKVSASRAKEREESITSRFCRLMDSIRAIEWGVRKRHAMNPNFITQR